MLTKAEKSLLRSDLFRHLDGLVTAPVAVSLQENGVISLIKSNETISLSRLSNETQANEGYLNVALRVLCCQGWLKQQRDNQTDEIIFQRTKLGEIAFDLFHIYQDVVGLLKLSAESFSWSVS